MVKICDSLIAVMIHLGATAKIIWYYRRDHRRIDMGVRDFLQRIVPAIAAEDAHQWRFQRDTGRNDEPYAPNYQVGMLNES